MSQDNIIQYLVDVSQNEVDSEDYATLEEILLFLAKGVRIDEGTTYKDFQLILNKVSVTNRLLIVCALLLITILVESLEQFFYQ